MGMWVDFWCLLVASTYVFVWPAFTLFKRWTIKSKHQNRPLESDIGLHEYIIADKRVKPYSHKTGSIRFQLTWNVSDLIETTKWFTEPRSSRNIIPNDPIVRKSTPEPVHCVHFAAETSATNDSQHNAFYNLIKTSSSYSTRSLCELQNYTSPRN